MSVVVIFDRPTVSVIRAPRAVVIAPIVIALSAVILARRKVPTASPFTTVAGWGPTTWRAVATAAWPTVSTRIKPPRGGWGCTSPLRLANKLRVSSAMSFGRAYLDLQEVVPPDSFIVHLMICIVSITATLIFHKGKSTPVLLAEYCFDVLERTYRRLAAVRGAGMSHRTRRPYL